MSKVSDYVDNMFCGLPPTEEVSAVKWQVTESLEDKYAALLTNGLTEMEALGVIVSEFGSMEEIYQSLGYTASGAASYSAVDPYLLVEYEEFRTKFAAGIGAGVAGCILAVALIEPIEWMWGEMVATTIMFLLLAVSVFNFIYWGIRSEKYSALKKQLKKEKEGGGPAAYTGKVHRKNSAEKMVRKITHTVCALIMPVFTIFFFLLGVFFGLWHPAWILFPLGGLLCGIAEIIGNAVANTLKE